MTNTVVDTIHLEVKERLHRWVEEEGIGFLPQPPFRLHEIPLKEFHLMDLVEIGQVSSQLRLLSNYFRLKKADIQVGISFYEFELKKKESEIFTKEVIDKKSKGKDTMVTVIRKNVDIDEEVISLRRVILDLRAKWELLESRILVCNETIATLSREIARRGINEEV